MTADPLPRVTTGRAVGPVDATQVPRFAGPTTFARLPEPGQVPRADIAVVGVPFDSSVTYRPGADIATAIGQIADAARALTADGTRLLAVGGDHTVALPLLRAAHERYGPLAVLHFDAHLDTWDTYFGEAYTHGTPFRRASEEGLIDLAHSTHVGIRGPLYAREDLPDSERLGFTTVDCGQIERDGLTAAIDRVRARLGDAPVYVSIDIDVLDPAFAPGTGTPRRAASRPGSCSPPCARSPTSASSGPTSSRSRRPTTTRRSPASRRRTWRTSCFPSWPSPRTDVRGGRRRAGCAGHAGSRCRATPAWTRFPVVPR